MGCVCMSTRLSVLVSPLTLRGTESSVACPSRYLDISLVSVHCPFQRFNRFSVVLVVLQVQRGDIIQNMRARNRTRRALASHSSSPERRLLAQTTWLWKASFYKHQGENVNHEEIIFILTSLSAVWSASCFHANSVQKVKQFFVSLIFAMFWHGCEMCHIK